MQLKDVLLLQIEEIAHKLRVHTNTLCCFLWTTFRVTAAKAVYVRRKKLQSHSKSRKTNKAPLTSPDSRTHRRKGTTPDTDLTTQTYLHPNFFLFN
jgi:hypothetical protein